MQELKDAPANTLLDQTKPTISRYLNDGVEVIDKKFGDDYAKEHPELLAAYLQAAGNDFNAAILARELINIRESLDSLSAAIEERR